MVSRQNLAQSFSHVLAFGRGRLGLLTALIALLSLLGAPAQTAEKVLLLPAGPVDALTSFTLKTSADHSPTLQESAPLPLHLQDGSRSTYTDLLVLPGGDLVLTGGGGRGIVFFDAAGQELDSLFAAGGMSAPASIAISQYLSPNKPEVLVLGDDTVGRVQTYDLIDRSYRSAFFFTSGADRATIARAIRLPDDRVATAVNWASLGLSALEIWSLDDPVDPEFALHSAPMERQSADLLDPMLYPLKDIMGHIDGRLLVTSRDRVAILEPAGAVIWEIDLADLNAVGAEFQSARFLGSGLIVVATRQPGHWTTPHINHALFLVDPEAEDPLLSRSAPLSAAPLRLELADGHGGTGTFGFFANAFDSPVIDPDALRLDEEPRLTPATFALDEGTALEFTLKNDSEFPLLLRRTELRFSASDCASIDPNQLPPNLWWARPARTLEPDQVWAERAGLSLTNLTPGVWCAQLSVVLRDGTRHGLGSPLQFEVLPAAYGPSGPVEVEDLGNFDSQNGDDSPWGDPGDDSKQGCACAGSPANSPPLFYLLILVGLLLRRHIHRRR